MRRAADDGGGTAGDGHLGSGVDGQGGERAVRRGRGHVHAGEGIGDGGQSGDSDE